MTRKTTSRAVLMAAPLMLGSAAFAGGDGWITSMDEAMKIAQAEGKAILMDFTGSDWCGWCIKLNEEVFSQSMFKEYAPEKFVLVELDFPSQKQLREEQVAHNEKWRDKIGIQGYPTIILADAQGAEFARTGYQPGGPADYIDHLDGLLTGKVIRDAALEAAAKLDGIARAKMLDWAMSVEGVSVPDADAMIEEIIALDPDNIAGLKDTYTRMLNDRKADEAFAEIQQKAFTGDTEGALAQLDEVLGAYELSAAKVAELEGFRIFALGMAGKHEEALAAVETFLAREDVDDEARQQVLMSAVNIHIETEQYDEAIATFEKAVDLAPDSEMGKMLSGQKQQFLDFIERSRSGTLETVPATEMQKVDDDD